MSGPAYTRVSDNTNSKTSRKASETDGETGTELDETNEKGLLVVHYRR